MRGYTVIYNAGEHKNLKYYFESANRTLAQEFVKSKFDGKTVKIVELVDEYLTKEDWVNEYSDMQDFFEETNHKFLNLKHSREHLFLTIEMDNIGISVFEIPEGYSIIGIDVLTKLVTFLKTLK